MSIQGLRVELAGRIWEVATTVREGPAWRIGFRSADNPRARLEALSEGSDLPQPSEVTRALYNTRYRWFVDLENRVWRAELSPRHEGGRANGKWMRFALESGIDRQRYPYDEPRGLAELPDRKLLELLLRAIRGL